MIAKENTNTIKIKPYLEKGGVYSLSIYTKKNKIINIKGLEKLFPFNINQIMVEKTIESEKAIKEIESILIKFDNEIKVFIKNWKYKYNSLSSISLEIFKNNFDIFGKVKIGTNQNEDEMFRNAYHGGRNEVFGNKLEEEKIYYFDFKSMYGKVMEESFPYGDYKIEENPKNIEKKGIYLVEVKSEKKEIPILPYKTFSKKFIFPNGEFEGWYHNDELNLFVENGGEIKKIKKGITFENEDNLFYEFSKKMQKLREKDNINKKIFKGIIVSLYGRLGMKKKISKTSFVLNKNDYESIEKKYKIISEIWINEKEFIGVIETEEEEIGEKKQINSNVFYASLITAKGRTLLYKAIKEVEKNKGRILYVDTDSIFAAFTDKIIEEDFKLIKWEKTKIKNCVFASTKMYSLKFKDNSYETKISGINQNKISFEEFFKKFYCSENLFKYEMNVKKISTYQYIEKNIEKYINFNTYDKRKFDKLKKKTKPFKILHEMILDS